MCLVAMTPNHRHYGQIKKPKFVIESVFLRFEVRRIVAGAESHAATLDSNPLFLGHMLTVRHGAAVFLVGD
jgi:hypothetical protein